MRPRRPAPSPADVRDAEDQADYLPGQEAGFAVPLPLLLPEREAP
ncbi:hypothetical protein ACFFOP_02770 [Sinosporangium siamense]